VFTELAVVANEAVVAKLDDNANDAEVAKLDDVALLALEANDADVDVPEKLADVAELAVTVI
jgi:hypothetical protein